MITIPDNPRLASEVQCNRCGIREYDSAKDEETIKTVFRGYGWTFIKFMCWCPGCTRKMENEEG